MGVKVRVILIHETGGCVLSTALTTDVRVGWGQGEQLHAVGGGVALTLVFTANKHRNGMNKGES